MLEGDTCFGGPHGVGELQVCPLFEGGAVAGKRCTLKRKDGRPLSVVKHASSMRDDDGAVVGAIEALIDISSWLDLEAELERLRERSSGRAGFGRLVGRHPAIPSRPNGGGSTGTTVT